MSLQISEKCCTFEVRYHLGENPDSNFFKNKAQAPCESQVYFSVLRVIAQRPEPILNF